MNCSGSYAYQALHDPHNDIRIAVLQPGVGSDAIRVDVLQRQSSSNLKYTALSYVWGDPNVISPIEINQRQLHITTNLESALRHLRDRYEPRNLWIDAICINQKDMAEREAQVSIMRSIYSQAEEIIVWLGPTSEDSDLAMEILSGKKSEILSQMQVHHASKTLHIHRAYVALHRLYQRAWWRRAWVIQEVTFKEKPVRLYCGRKSVQWADSAYAVRQLHFSIDSAQRSYRTASHGQQESVIYDEVRKGLLEALAPAVFLHSQCDRPQRPASYTAQLGQVRVFEASDARDKVWIAETLSNLFPSNKVAVKPNYSLTLRKTFLYSVQQCLRHDGLDFLDQCDLRNDTPLDLPTFVPDWRKPHMRKFRLLKGAEGYFAACRGNFTSQRLPNCDNHHLPEKRDFSVSLMGDSMLSVRGILVDEVKCRTIHQRIRT